MTSTALPTHDPRQVEDADGSLVGAWEQGQRWRALPSAMGRALVFTFRAAPSTAALAMLLAVIGAVMYAALYTLLQRMVGVAERIGSVAALLGPSLLPLVVLGAVLLTGRAVTTAAEHYIDWSLHNQVFGHTDMATLRAAARVPLEQFEDADFYALLQRCANSVGQVCAAAPKIVRVLGDLVSALAIALALSITNGWLIPVAAAAALPALVTEVWAAHEWYRVQVRIAWPARLRYYLDNQARSRSAAAEIRALDLGETFETWSRTAFQNMAGPQRAAIRARGRRTLLASCLSGVIMVVGAALSLRHGAGALAALVTTVVGLTQLRAIFSGMFSTLSEVADAALYLRDLEELEALGGPQAPVTPALTDLITPVEPVAAALRQVTIEGLGYRYPGAERRAIADVSLSLQAGDLVAVVGRNGSGKTTLAKVLAGLLPATEGSVRWNGADYLEVPGAVRRGVTMQSQEPTRWCFTVRENIGLGDTGKPDTESEVWAALEQAQLTEVVRALPEGLGTRLGKELGPGADLSGGQWQRLALARCFFRNSELVILDEPTSAFDAIASPASTRTFIGPSWRT